MKLNLQLIDLFKDKNGKIVTWQKPNLPIIAWFLLKIFSMIIDHQPTKDGLTSLATAFLFVWAYLEITDGANYFRRLLGLIIGAGIIISFFG